MIYPVMASHQQERYNDWRDKLGSGKHESISCWIKLPDFYLFSLIQYKMNVTDEMQIRQTLKTLCNIYR